MDKDSLDEVGKLLEVEVSNVVDSKLKRLFKGMFFPFIQVGYFLASSSLGLAFGQWENKSPSIYPYGGLIARVYTFGTIAVLGLNTGNVALSVKTRKRFGLDTAQLVLAIVINLVLSLISFFLLYNLIRTYSDPSCMTSPVRYNVYLKKKLEYK